MLPGRMQVNGEDPTASDKLLEALPQSSGRLERNRRAHRAAFASAPR